MIDFDIILSLFDTIGQMRWSDINIKDFLRHFGELGAEM